VVVLPQCRKEKWWTFPEMEAQTIAALDESIREFHGDPARVYLTGLSMGGYGTWSLGSKYPGRFAALAPICGGVRLPRGARLPAGIPEPPPDPYAAASRKIGKTPVWIFHGGADPVVPVSESRQMNEALKTAGGNVRYTEYEKVGHNSWDRAYAEPEVFTWLLSQRRVE
ncbi:MAG: phospholipase, partial [Acidobacteria bacterium]